MRKTKKVKILIILLLLLVVSIIVIAILLLNKQKLHEEQNKISVNQQEQSVGVNDFVQTFEDGTKLNISPKLNEEKEVGGLKFRNIQFTERNNQSLLLADVTNNSEKALDVTLINITLLRKDGSEIAKFSGIISALQSGETTQFTTSVSLDYVDAYDLKITIQK